MNDSLGNRMKEFEDTSKLTKQLPIYCRLDGICFHSFCEDLRKPYDERLSNLMIQVTKYLLQEFNANCGYTQSDEISLGWNLDEQTEMMCGGKIQKLLTHLSSKASVRFNRLLPSYIPEKADVEACFDARLHIMPNLSEAANAFLWRELDAAKNSISMAASNYFEHNELMNKTGSEKQEMLFSKHGINWNDYPNVFKRGRFIIKKRVLVKYTTEDLESLPEKHNARKNPDLMIEKTQYLEYPDLPRFNTVQNREGFLFLGEEPQIIKEF